MNELRIGIVGLGWVAGAHIEAFKNVRGARVTAVCSRRALDGALLQQQYGIPLRAYSDYDALLADPEIDAIDICTPHPLHPAQAIAAARAGKHLIIEKPLAINYPDLLAMRDAINQSGVNVCVCFEVRFSQYATTLRALKEQELLGEIHYGEIDYYHGVGPWYGQFGWNIKKDFGGSSLLTAGCHALDLLLGVMGTSVEEVTSYATHSRNPIFAPYEYPTTTVTILKFANGTVGKVASVIDCVQPYYFHIHLVGSHGSLLDNRFHSAKLSLNKAKWSQFAVPLIDSGDVSDHPYQPQFQAFVKSTLSNQPMPQTDFATAFETHRVIFASDLSATEGRPVKLSEFAI
jgi:predicted dehydrogenase